MKLNFLGTGAAIYIRVPENEMKEGARRCSSMLVDGRILIDLPMQCIDFAAKLGVDLSGVTDVLLTHSHDDHFQKSSLMKLAGLTKEKLNFWCHKKAVENLELDESDLSMINLHTLDLMEKWETAGATITALPANHLTRGEEQPMHYIIEKDGKSLFYGCDGGWFRADTWEYMRRVKLDCAVLDATVGDDAGNFRIGTHNSIPMLKILIAAFLQNKIMGENGKFIANHIAPTVYQMTEDEISAALAEIGMIKTFDGMEFEF